MNLASLLVVVVVVVVVVGPALAVAQSGFYLWTNNVNGPTNWNNTNVVATDGVVAPTYAVPDPIPKDHVVGADVEFMRFYVATSQPGGVHYEVKVSIVTDTPAPIGTVSIDLGQAGHAPEVAAPGPAASVVLLFLCSGDGEFVAKIEVTGDGAPLVFYMGKTCVQANPRLGFTMGLVAEVIYEAAVEGKTTSLFGPQAIFGTHIVSDRTDAHDVFRMWLADTSHGVKQEWSIAALDFDTSIVEVTPVVLNGDVASPISLGNFHDASGLRLNYKCLDRQDEIETQVSLSLHLKKSLGGKPYDGITVSWGKTCGPPVSLLLSVWFFMWLIAIVFGVSLLVCHSREDTEGRGSTMRAQCLACLDCAVTSCHATCVAPFLGSGHTVLGGGASDMDDDEEADYADARSSLLDVGSTPASAQGTPMVPLGSSRGRKKDRSAERKLLALNNKEDYTAL